MGRPEHLWEPVPGPLHPHREEFLPNIQLLILTLLLSEDDAHQAELLWMSDLLSGLEDAPQQGEETEQVKK